MRRDSPDSLDVKKRVFEAEKLVVSGGHVVRCVVGYVERMVGVEFAAPR